ncbi:recombinase family protein [Fodinisporobacter ferrooxydans]|uniref:Recombinase family protein n=1 Tax=Fodinisporobacter ferrooxydans TaxID=2901836 RepID=A0ABY4CK05_9BACL|nr:recombinase family protein [Alicyclobacillaceae bacterium MYW30-H2]
MEAEARGEGETLSKHRRALFEMAKKYRYAIEDVYEEIVSGERIIDRPEMQKLIHTVREGKYKAVLCMDLDRLGRGNMVDQGLIQDAFKSSNTLIITPRKVYNLQDEMDEEWSEFEAFMARRELKIITRRMQRGRKQSAAEGKSISKKPPYGYLRDDSLKLYPDPETSPVVKMIFGLAAEGKGRRTIAAKLTDMDIPTPSGKANWDGSTITAIITNEVYLGHIIWGRMNYKKNQQSDGSYVRKRADESDWIVHENAHEPLVDAETFERARFNATKQKPKVPETRELSSPLAALIFCKNCGHAMRRQKTYNRPFNSLLCNTYGCTTRGARFEIVEERLLHTLKDMLHGIELSPSMDNGQHRNKLESMIEMTKKKVDSLQESISELQKQRNNLHDLLERGVYDVDTFLERNRVVNDRLEQLNGELDSSTSELVLLNDESQKQNDLAPRISQVLASYEAAQTAQEKNDLLRSIIERAVYVRPQEWRKKDQFDLEVYLRV